MRSELTIRDLCSEAATFAERESAHNEPSLYGVTDGKVVGTYVEHKFQDVLSASYTYGQGSSAQGVDFPELNVDIKTTSIKQPQSSSPFKSARQKIYGLGYSLLVFVYDKTDDDNARTARLNILHTIFVEAARTADYQTTRGIREIVAKEGNTEDLVAFITDRHLPIDEVAANALAEELLLKPPRPGYLTVSNALQWRLTFWRLHANARSRVSHRFKRSSMATAIQTGY